MPTQIINTGASSLDATTYLALSSGYTNPITGVPPGPVNIFSIEGFCGGVANTVYYLQILDAIPPNGRALYSVGVMGALPFSFIYPEGLSTAQMGDGVIVGDNTLPTYLAISSTDGTYTAVAATTTANVALEETFVFPRNATQVSGTNVANKTIWADAAGAPAKRLCYFTAKNTLGADGYLMLFAYAGAATGATPIQEWKVTSGSTIQQTFGNTGLAVQQGTPLDYIQHYGCYLVASSTPQTLTTVANGWTIYAWNI